MNGQITRARMRLAGGTALLVAATLTASACQAGGSPDAGAGGARSSAAGASTAVAAGTGGSAAAAPVPVMVDVSPADGLTGVRPDSPVSVQAAGGRLTAVTVTGPGRSTVAGRLSADGFGWAASGPLRYGARYTTRAVITDSTGAARTKVASFTTLTPKTTVSTSISPLRGTTVGVGMPIVVKLSRPVRDRVAVERGLVVRTSRSVEGSWSWISAEELHYRPRVYWPADTAVRLDVRLLGVHAGGGAWGAKNRTVDFTVGSSSINVVDVKSLRMRVYRSGRLVRTIPVTTGKEGFLTRGGIKVISEKYRSKVMDAATNNVSTSDPEYYRLTVPYAMRVTWSGEFVHGAPWSVSNQGRARVSHGCVGMSMADAAFVFEGTKVGDVVQVVNSTRGLEQGNGWTDWNVGWETWRAASALARTAPEVR